MYNKGETSSGEVSPESKPMARNYSGIWAKYSQYNESNTLMVSNHMNLIEDFQRNDLVLPTFHPTKGTTDFMDDKHLAWAKRYIDMCSSMETTIGPDVRKQMELMRYE